MIHHGPVELAPRIRLYPWDSARPELEPGWLALAQHGQVGTAGAVLGDGSHPTTRLCAAVVDQLCRQRRPEAVLDVGTGTGVLARIARARGATFVVGTDIDTQALAVASANLALDGHVVAIALGAEAPDHWWAACVFEKCEKPSIPGRPRARTLDVGAPSCEPPGD